MTVGRIGEVNEYGRGMKGFRELVEKVRLRHFRDVGRRAGL